MSKPPKTGIESVVEMLQYLDGPSREKLLQNLHERDPHLVEELNRRIWSFEELKKLEGPDLQLLLREIPMRKLALALRKASDEVRAHIYKNLSQRAATALDEDVKALGPQKLTLVERAQKEIGQQLKLLVESGKLKL